MALPTENTFDDTIAAVCTAMEESGIGIIRISGSNAIPIADRFYRTAKMQRKLADFGANTIHFGYFVREDGTVIDEIMASVMKAPHSYTTEDTVEINAHGGILLLQEILETLLEAGCRLAEPGEFTKRAFFGGRIDLSRAEAVMDLISSKSETARKISMNQLRGGLSDEIKEIRAEILYEIAFIESALDDPENYSLDGYPEKLREKTEKISVRLQKMIDESKNGRLLKEGIAACILGRPNAGKSSLMNRLSGSERSIVTDIEGTTRDTLEEKIRLNSISLSLVDTAGIRDTEDKIEKIGVKRALDAAENSNLILVVFDLSARPSKEDGDVLKSAVSFYEQGKKVIFLLNKKDLCKNETEKISAEVGSTKVGSMEVGSDKGNSVEQVYREMIAAEFSEGGDNPVILEISAADGTGIDELTQKIEAMYRCGNLSLTSEPLMTNSRHTALAVKAVNSLRLVLRSIENGESEDFYSIDLMSAYSELGKILGEQVEDDLVEEIFSRFCMGK